MSKSISVVAVQMDIVPLESQVNIKKALGLMQDAIKEHGSVDLFVLPEDFITGPIPRHTETHCLNNKSPEVQVFVEFAKHHKAHIVLGSFIKRVNGNLYNTTLVIDDSGKVVLEHHKTKLSWAERSYITPGDELKVVKTIIGTIGILNCWEIADPLIARKLVQKGADILCSPSYWANGDLPTAAKRINKNFDIDFVNHALPTLAFQFNSLVAYANVCGDAAVQLKTRPWKSYGMGQSQICVPLLGTVQHMPEVNEEGYVFYAYDKQLARIAEEITELRKDINN